MQQPSIKTSTGRIAKLTVILGAPGTGKTSFLRELLERTPNRKTLIVTPHDVEWTDYPINDLASRSDYLYTGIRRHIFNPDKEVGTLKRLNAFRKGVVVFDDCRAYFSSSTSLEVRTLLISKRQRMIDVFAVGHGFKQVPPEFFTFATDYIIFNTRDNITLRKDVILNYEQMAAAQAHVNSKALIDPHYKIHVKV